MRINQIYMNHLSTKQKIKNLFLFMGLLIFLGITSCNDNTIDPVNSGDDNNNEIATEENDDTVADAEAENGESHEETADYTWDAASAISVTLNGTSISGSSTGATIDGSKLTITSAGTYRLSGTLTDGQIVVETKDEDPVKLVLDGVDISNSSSAPIFISGAEKTIIILADNSGNTLSDAASYVYEDAEEDEPNATIFSKDDLSICGNGSLTVKGNYNDGIASKDGLIIASGTISVDAVDDGIRGKDYLIIKDGTITVESGGDGLKSDNDDETELGYIDIMYADLTINAGDDGITAASDAMITDGNFTIKTAGGSSGNYSSSSSAKGIKATSNLIIDGGNFEINSGDDALHSNDALVINSGTFEISSGDDGIHADETLGINGGEINITKSYEGIESAIITISDGTIHLTASDDGLNVARGNDSSGMHGWSPTTSGNYYLYLTGGYIYINAMGDGVDVNGSVVMDGGDLIVNGPTSNNNGALDYDGSFKINGGFLLAAGSSGMAQAPGSSSSQYSILVNFTQTISAGTLVHLENSSGETLFTFAPAKNIQSVAFSSPDLSNGGKYNLYYGGSTTGVSVDGLYENETYSSGTEYTSFTISNIVTKISSR